MWVLPEDVARIDHGNNGLHVAWESWRYGGQVSIGTSKRGVTVPKEHLDHLIRALRQARRELELIDTDRALGEPGAE